MQALAHAPLLAFRGSMAEKSVEKGRCSVHGRRLARIEALTGSPSKVLMFRSNLEPP
jgi:hypothetical protein